MNYGDDDLEKMRSDLESDLVERKRSLSGDAANKIRETICAFANDLPNHRAPGVVFVGLNDDGTPSDLAISDELLLTLASMKSDGNIVPPPTMTVSKYSFDGRDVAVVTVWPADSPPVRYRGRIHIRVGPRRDIATAQDERILNEKRRARDRPFDVQPLRNATIADLNVTRFTHEYLVAAVAPDILEANDRTIEERLAATKMIVSVDDQAPTVLGVLVIGTAPRAALPGAYVQFLRVDGVQFGDPIVDELAIEGTVSDMVHRLDDKCLAHNRTQVDFTSGPIEIRKSMYPLSALHQLTRNAILHRNYDGTNAPVRVNWFNDRIEIVNPGGPYGDVNAENLGEPGVTDYRNPNLAEAMRVLGLVQRFGGGISVARSALENNGNPPLEYRISGNFLTAIVRPAY